MKLLLRYLLPGLLAAWLASPAQAGTPGRPLTRLDSLRQLPRWPRTTQVRLARSRLTEYAGPGGPAQAAAAAEKLTRQRLDSTVYLELLGNLAGYYIHVRQPSLAIARLLEVRQRAWADSARSANAAIWLSYCYAELKQGRPTLAFGREAVRRLPPHAANYVDELIEANCMVADGAELLHDWRLQARCYRRNLQLARQVADGYEVANAYIGLASLALSEHRYAPAAQLLDSSRAAFDARSGPGLLNEQDQLAGRLALARHQYAAAEQALRPALRRAQTRREPLWETAVLELLVPALTGRGHYREALAGQQRLAALQATAFEENANRRAQGLEARYAAAQREQELTRQRQHIALLQAQAGQREAEYGRRLAWLGAAVLAGVLLTVLGVGLWASRQRRQRTAREERLRSRIAADLHDEVGTLLTRVSMQADLLSQQQPEHGPDLARLLGNSRAAARTMRDIVWSIDAQADTMGALLDRMRDHLDQSAASIGLLTQLHTESLRDDQALPAELRQHLYLVFKEAVTNAVRHAVRPTRLDVSLTRPTGHTLLLTVANDGQPAPAPSRSGMGLRNMRQRAAVLRGHLEAGPLANGGFRVQLTVPG